MLRFRLMIKRGLNETATSIRKVKRSMKYYAGLDVSVKETSVCIVDESGNVCRERKVISHPDDLVAVLSDPAFNFERVGLEAGPLSQWLFEGLAHKEPHIRAASEAELRALTGEYFGYHFDLPRREREQARVRWQSWWYESGRARKKT